VKESDTAKMENGPVADGDTIRLLVMFINLEVGTFVEGV
jgi:hypothetical protein